MGLGENLRLRDGATGCGCVLWVVSWGGRVVAGAHCQPAAFSPARGPVASLAERKKAGSLFRAEFTMWHQICT
jgi:hypothetical protein